MSMEKNRVQKKVIEVVLSARKTSNASVSLSMSKDVHPQRCAKRSMQMVSSVALNIIQIDGTETIVSLSRVNVTKKVLAKDSTR